MTTTVVDETVAPLALALLERLRVEMGKVPTPPAKVEIRPGDQVAALISTAEDECCGGLAWVRVDLVYPSTVGFPAYEAGPHKCGPGRLAVLLEVGAMRCAPVGDADTLPTAEEWAAAALAVLDDRAALRRAICAFMGLESNRGRLFSVGQGSPLPVQGACTGAVDSVTVSVQPCDCARATDA